MKRSKHSASVIRQPWAELMLRGEKTVEYRSQITKIRERVYVYASATKPDLTDNEIRQEVGCSLSELPKGVLVGSVEIVDCIGSDGECAICVGQPNLIPIPIPSSAHIIPICGSTSASPGIRRGILLIGL